MTGRAARLRQDADGEEEAKEASIDPVNQSMRIGALSLLDRRGSVVARKIWSKQRDDQGLSHTIRDETRERTEICNSLEFDFVVHFRHS